MLSGCFIFAGGHNIVESAVVIGHALHIIIGRAGAALIGIGGSTRGSGSRGIVDRECLGAGNRTVPLRQGDIHCIDIGTVCAQERDRGIGLLEHSQTRKVTVGRALYHIVVGHLFQGCAADFVLPNTVGGKCGVGLVVHGGHIEVGDTVVNNGAHIIAMSHFQKVRQRGVVGELHQGGGATADGSPIETG